MRHITQSQSSKLHLNVMFELASAEPLAVLSQLIEPLRNGETAGEGSINHPVDGQFYAVRQETVVGDKTPEEAGNL